jgi:hypothetical protein
MLRSLTDTLYTSLLPVYDPHAKHDDVTMEGYYAHLHAPAASGDPHTLVVIFCEVQTAVDPAARVMVYVLYAPAHVPPHAPQADAQRPRGFMRELTAPGWNITRKGQRGTGRTEEWKVDVDGVGSMEIGRDVQRWVVHIPPEEEGADWMDLVVETRDRTPWTAQSEVAGPEGSFFFILHDSVLS